MLTIPGEDGSPLLKNDPSDLAFSLIHSLYSVSILFEMFIWIMNQTFIWIIVNQNIII